MSQLARVKNAGRAKRSLEETFVESQLQLSNMPNKRKRSENDALTNRVNRRKTGAVSTRMVTAPVSGGVVISRRVVPRFSSNTIGTVVDNTEMVSNVNLAALGAFTTFSNALIPSLPGWLNGVSELYSKYRWRRLRVIYVPKCPTATPGTVAMAITYDRQDAAPTSLSNLSQTNKAILFPAYAGYGGAQMLSTKTPGPESIYIDVDISRFEKNWYSVVTPATLTALATAVQTMYVPATLQVAHADGAAVGVGAGDIYFQYEIEFIEPINPAMST